MRISILDDQPGWAMRIACGLQNAGYDARSYFYVSEALANFYPADFLVVDYHLPATTGVEIVCRACDLGWSGSAILTTPYPRQIHYLDHPSIRMTLLKPYDVADLIEAIALIQADIAISRWHRSTNGLLTPLSSPACGGAVP